MQKKAVMVFGFFNPIYKGQSEYFNNANANATVGDQHNDTIPERPICKKIGIALIDGQGDKVQSSS